MNGRGNLIIGYDAVRTSGTLTCSDGQYTNQTDCETNGATWAVSHKSGSHYMVIGDQNNYFQYGGLITGYDNTSNREYASVSGGQGCTVSPNNGWDVGNAASSGCSPNVGQ